MDDQFVELFLSDQPVTSFDIGKEYIYLLCGLTVFKIDNQDGQTCKKHDLFQKEGLSRALIADSTYVYCKDFIDLHILDIETLGPVQNIKLGTDLSSDICSMGVDENYLYISIRNGSMVKIDKKNEFTKETYPVSDSSIWYFTLWRDCIFAGNVDGDLLIIDKASMDVIQRIETSKQNLKSILITEQLLITASQDKKMIVRDVQNYATIKSLSNVHKKAFSIVGIHADLVYTICFRFGEIKAWDSGSWKLVRILNFPGALTGEACIRDGHLYLASRNINGLVYKDLYSVTD